MSVVLFFVFFFFKQKTAYEMRISDWSSDVCSSDLRLEPAAKLIDQREGAEAEQGDVLVDASHLGYRDRAQPEDRREVDEDIERQPEHRHHGADRRPEPLFQELRHGVDFIFQEDRQEQFADDKQRQRRHPLIESDRKPDRTEERRGGKEWGSTGRTRG